MPTGRRPAAPNRAGGSSSGSPGGARGEPRRTLAFVEVKTRRAALGGAGSAKAERPQPLDGLLPAQRARLRRLAVAWLSERRPPGVHARLIRFDAIGVVLDGGGALVSLEHLKGAW